MCSEAMACLLESASRAEKAAEAAVCEACMVLTSWMVQLDS